MSVQNRGQEIRIKTMSGEIVIKRTYYNCRECQYGECQYDEMLGIAELPHKITRELMIETAYYGQNQS